MKFLILTQYFYPETGAAQVRLWELAKELVRKGCEVTVVAPFPNHPSGIIPPSYRGKSFVAEIHDGIKINRTWIKPAKGKGFFRRLISYFSFVLACWWGILRVRDVDVIFIESPPLFLGISGYIASKIKRAPYVFNVSDLWPESAVKLGIVRNKSLIFLAEKLESFLYRNAFALSAATIGVKEGIKKKGIPERKICFLPNGADIESFRPMEPDGALAGSLGVSGKKVFIYAGTIGFAHGATILAEVAQKLKCRPDIVFLILGEGSEKEDLLSVEEKYSLTNMRILNFQPPSELPRYFSIATAALVTLKKNPLFEGTRPAKMFPAMAAGKPVIYSGEGEGARLISESQCGIVVSPEDSDALTEAVAGMADDCASAEQMGVKGREFVVANYAWSTIVDRWLQEITTLYQEKLECGKRRRRRNG